MSWEDLPPNRSAGALKSVPRRRNNAMNIIFALILESIAFLVGVALILYAKPLSVRFNAESASQADTPSRRKAKQTKRSPSPPLNLGTVTTLFRIAGIFLVLGTVLPLLAIAITRHRH
jgi:hypothetical protein